MHIEILEGLQENAVIANSLVRSSGGGLFGGHEKPLPAGSRAGHHQSGWLWCSRSVPPVPATDAGAVPAVFTAPPAANTYTGTAAAAAVLVLRRTCWCGAAPAADTGAVLQARGSTAGALSAFIDFFFFVVYRAAAAAAVAAA